MRHNRVYRIELRFASPSGLGPIIRAQTFTYEASYRRALERLIAATMTHPRVVVLTATPDNPLREAFHV